MTATRQPATTTSARKGTRARRPGRPAATAVSGEQFREVILAAAGEVYARDGYHGVTVERIIEAAGISRPTFYRYFTDRHVVLDAVVARVNDELRDLIAAAVAETDDIEVFLERVVDAYFAWGERIGPMAGPIYREIHDEASPASAHRTRLLDELMALFTEQPIEGLDVTDEPLLYDAAMHVVEHLGHATFWPRKLPAAERTRRRALILQALRALLIPDRGDP